MPENDIKLRDGRIVRSEEPLNLEMPFETVDSFITPTKSFYVRTHFPIPKIDRDAWWLHVEGEVEKPFAINYEELLKIRIADDPGDAGMRREQSQFSRTESQRRAMGTWAQSAPRNGPACHCRSCLIARSSSQMHVKSFWKERTAACSTIRRVLHMAN